MHGDLNMSTIFLDEYLHPKITDFTDYGMPIQHEYEDVENFAELVETMINDVYEKEKVPSCYKNLIRKCNNKKKKEKPTLEEIIYHLKNNPEFITDSVDKEEFQNYVKYVDMSQKDQNYAKMDSFDFILTNNFSFRKVNLDTQTLKQVEKIKFKIEMGSIDISNYVKICNIGEGNFGVVYSVYEKKTNNIFAAKKSKKSIDECSNDFILNLEREINIISNFQHNSILQFIGFTKYNFNKTKEKPIIITELVSNGSLGNIILNERMGLAPHEWDDTKKLINIYGIASGMKYIHSFDILHCDLKPDNILLDDSLYPKICDFGLSKNLNDTDYINKRIKKEKINEKSLFKGTPIYCSPEILSKNQYSKAGDIYAFGLIVFEIITNDVIIIDNCNFYNLLLRINNGYRPEFRFQIPYCYKKLIEDCWSQDPEKRPPFSKIVKMIETNSNFITSLNIDENEFENYVFLTKENPSMTVNYIENDEKYIKNISKEDENYETDSFLDLSRFEIESIISNGIFSKLYKLKDKETNLFYQGQISVNKMKKILDDDIQLISKQIKKIKELKHPSLLKFIGYNPFDFKKQIKPIIVTELPSNISLSKLFEFLRVNNSIEGWNDTKKLMSIYGIASSLSYLHFNDIIHRSLNPSNIYLDEIFLPKIGDFGLSTFFDNSNNLTHQSMVQNKTDFIYKAPEIFVSNEFSKSSDVYAFGMIVYEIVTNEIPFNEIDNDIQLLKMIVDMQYRPNIKEKVPVSYMKLIEKCWSQNPDERPNFEEIVHLLKVDKGFITNEINDDDFQQYINLIDEGINTNKYSNKSSKLYRENLIIEEEEKQKLIIEEEEKEPKLIIEEEEEKSKLIIEEEEPNLIIEEEEEKSKIIIIENNNNLNLNDNEIEQSDFSLNDTENIYDNEILMKKYISLNDTENIYKYFCILIKDGNCRIPLEYSVNLYKKKFYKQALNYFELIAKVNNPIAKYYIGVMKFHGEGCNKDKEESYKILKNLSENGIEKATDFINDYF